ncbi:MAG TPA: hypothetical protein VGS78_01795 [Candidatus Sulfotelmatobacter sp.]|nr:hypothetical protein [Candidatus Sulfotelmatobacter sp.]
MAVSASSTSDRVREQVSRNYVETARRQGLVTFSVNVGEVQKESKLRNRVSLVCSALKSRKFLQANGLRLISESGPPSGLSTTVTYTYEFVDGGDSAGPRSPNGLGGTPQSRQAAWEKLRGALKDVFAEYGGGEAYLRAERASFRDADERK